MNTKASDELRIKIIVFNSLLINEFIDFNGSSTRLVLFYTNRLGNRVHCTFIYTFFALLLFKSCFFLLASFQIRIIYELFGLAVRVFANGPGDRGSILGRVIPKTQKMVLDASLLNTQDYKVWTKGTVEQSRERGSAFPLLIRVVAIEKGTFGSPSTKVNNFTLLTNYL